MQTLLAPTVQKDTLLVRLIGSEPAPAHRVFTGKAGESWWESTTEVWLGTGRKADAPSLRKLVRKFYYGRKYSWPESVAINIDGLGEAEVESVVTGVMTGGYDIQLYKTKPVKLSPLFGEKGKLILITADKKTKKISEAISKATLTAQIQLRVMDLMNAPGNKKNPGTLAKWALESGDTYGYSVKVYDQTELQHYGLAALLSVNQGSPQDAAMIVMEYTPEHYKKTVALVGKGVTFDTGGISIKTSNNMHLMKSDMGGAAAVMGTVELAVRLGLPVRLIGIIPATENCIDGNSTKPGDVVDSYSGKTIEVIDTDAEGRIILADGLSYAVREYKPDYLIDLATLTGSIVQTLGYHAAGLFTANDALATALEKAGETSGERVWRLPLWEDYADEIQSDIADVRNFHGKPLAGAIVAAKFLEVFTDEHPAWAHLDIAGTAFGDADLIPGRAGTAFGISLLRKFLENLD